MNTPRGRSSSSSETLSSIVRSMVSANADDTDDDAIAEVEGRRYGRDVDGPIQQDESSK